MRTPSSIASETPRMISTSRALRPAAPSRTRYRPETRTALKPGRSPSSSMCTILARSSLSMTGYGRAIWRHDAGPGWSRLLSGPMVHATLVTNSSRIASSGGLVTCAKSWVK